MDLVTGDVLSDSVYVLQRPALGDAAASQGTTSQDFEIGLMATGTHTKRSVSLIKPKAILYSEISVYRVRFCKFNYRVRFREFIKWDSWFWNLIKRECHSVEIYWAKNFGKRRDLSWRFLVQMPYKLVVTVTVTVTVLQLHQACVTCLYMRCCYRYVSLSQLKCKHDGLRSMTFSKPSTIGHASKAIKDRACFKSHQR